MTNKLRIPKLYSKIAKHYLKVQRLHRGELSKTLDAIDDVDLFYDGKKSVTVRGSMGSYVGERKGHQVNWKEFTAREIAKEDTIEPKPGRRIHKKRTFRRKRI